MCSPSSPALHDLATILLLGCVILSRIIDRINGKTHLDGVKPGVFKVGPVECDLGMRFEVSVTDGSGLKNQTLRIRDPMFAFKSHCAGYSFLDGVRVLVSRCCTWRTMLVP